MKKRALRARVAELEAEVGTLTAAHADALDEAAKWRKSSDAWARKFATAAQDFDPVAAERDELARKLAAAKAQTALDCEQIEDLSARLERMGHALELNQSALDAADVTVEAQAAALADVVALARKAAPHMPHGGSRSRYRQQLRHFEALLRPPD